MNTWLKYISAYIGLKVRTDWEKQLNSSFPSLL